MNVRPFVPVMLSALAFGLAAPLSKLLLRDIPPISMAGLLYVGAFAGLALYSCARWISRRIRRADAGRRFDPLRAGDLPWLAGAIAAGGVVGPVCLMLGLERTSGASASLLLNLEGLATALIAVLLFREPAGRRTWAALAAMTAAGLLTTWDPGSGRFEASGPLLVLVAMVSWGLDNNLTRNISDKDPVLIAGIKGVAAGAFSLGWPRRPESGRRSGFPRSRPWPSGPSAMDSAWCCSSGPSDGSARFGPGPSSALPPSSGRLSRSPFWESPPIGPSGRRPP